MKLYVLKRKGDWKKKNRPISLSQPKRHETLVKHLFYAPHTLTFKSIEAELQLQLAYALLEIGIGSGSFPTKFLPTSGSGIFLNRPSAQSGGTTKWTSSMAGLNSSSISYAGGFFYLCTATAQKMECSTF